MRNNKEVDFPEFHIPTSMKIAWGVGAVVSLSVTGFLMWAIYTLVTHFTS